MNIYIYVMLKHSISETPMNKCSSRHWSANTAPFCYVISSCRAANSQPRGAVSRRVS